MGKLVLADTVYFFPFRFENQSGRLWREGEERVLRPKSAAVLHYLVTHPGQIVSKDELLTAVWPEVIVSEAVLTVCISELRQALADDPQQPRFIATVHRRGYRFLTAVTTAPPVLSSQLSVVSSDKAEPKPQSVATGHWPLTTPFVGREAELVQLQQWWELALSGQRQVVFVAGEPGIGKTTLIDRSLASISHAHAHEHAHEFWIGRGQCVEQYGEGEAYLPVLEALGHLCRGPEGQQVQEVLHRYAPTWLLQMPGLQEATEVEALRLRTAGATRERMLREMADAMEALTTERGLVLACEDLHASDRSTIELLAYLAQRRGAARLLILGTYRPAEVIVRAHPLRQIVQDLHGRQQCQYLSLELLSQAAVGDYLAQRLAPGSVSPSLTAEVYQKTGGNALFMVTVVEYLLQQELLRKEDGQWRLQGRLQHIGVPESARLLIEKQIEQLSTEERQVLEIASVVGVEFSAAAVSAGLMLDTARAEPSRVEEQCEELSRRTPFLQDSGSVVWPDGTVTMGYGFRHALYQEVVYKRLSPGRRSQLHQRIGERLEAAYGERAREIAAELAVHFEQGREFTRAVQYRQAAAQRALGQHAAREALDHLARGLSLLSHVPAGPMHGQLELMLQTTYGVTLATMQGYAAPEVEQALLRAHELSRQVTDPALLSPILCGLWSFFIARSDFVRATALADQLVTLANQHPETPTPALAYGIHGQTCLLAGKLTTARASFDQSLTFYTADQHGQLLAQYNEDPGVISATLQAQTLWLLGYTDQSRHQLAVGKALAHELAHPYSLAQHLSHAMILQQWCGDAGQVLYGGSELQEACKDEAFPVWLTSGAIIQGWALVHQGQSEEGLALLRQGIDDWQTRGIRLLLPYYWGLLAEAYGYVGRPNDGLQVLDEALAHIDVTQERFYEAELWRLKGEVTLQQSSVQGLESSVKKSGKSKVKSGKLQVPSAQHLTPNPQAEAEACFFKAIDIARKRQAKSLELRAVMSLARLWQQRGKVKDAHFMLAEIYGWFTEGFDTVDLREAKALLDALSQIPHSPCKLQI